MASPTDTESPFQLLETFHSKYDEFAEDLLSTFPELEAPIRVAQALPKDERVKAYKDTVFVSTKGISAKDLEKAPGIVLPGVSISASIWETTGRKTKMAILEYLSILNLCVGLNSPDSEEFTKEWAERLMREARASMSKLDFEKLSQTFFNAFGSNGENLPPLPEKFLKGKLAKLAEDMVREFKPEDFGLKPEEIEACERDPTRAFEILMNASMSNPQLIQSAMGRVAKKLKDKVARGELKPQELVAEAEELIKEFQNHPAFVELMETFRSAFSFNDPEAARAAGQEQSARLSLVRDRLRKKLDAKKAGKK